MKKQIFIGIAIIACIALCAAVWPRSAVVEDLPAESIKLAINAKIKACQKEAPPIILSADNSAPELEAVSENDTAEAEVITEEKTESTPPAKPVQKPTVVEPAPAQSSSDPKPRTIAVIDGVQCMWIPGFGWVKDEGGGSISITVDGKGDINKQVVRHGRRLDSRKPR